MFSKSFITSGPVNMRDVIYVKLGIVYSINQQVNETISRKSYFLKQ